MCRLHEMVNVSMLYSRRDIQLLNIMFTLSDTNAFRKVGIRSTRSIYKYEFTVDAV